MNAKDFTFVQFEWLAKSRIDLLLQKEQLPPEEEEVVEEEVPELPLRLVRHEVVESQSASRARTFSGISSKEIRL